MIQRRIIQQVTFAVSIPRVWEQSISWLPRVCSHELLKPSVSWQEKSIDVSFISILCLVRKLQKLEGVSSESASSIVYVPSFLSSSAFVSSILCRPMPLVMTLPALVLLVVVIGVAGAHQSLRLRGCTDTGLNPCFSKCPPTHSCG